MRIVNIWNVLINYLAELIYSKRMTKTSANDNTTAATK